MTREFSRLSSRSCRDKAVRSGGWLQQEEKNMRRKGKGWEWQVQVNGSQEAQGYTDTYPHRTRSVSEVPSLVPIRPVWDVFVLFSCGAGGVNQVPTEQVEKGVVPIAVSRSTEGRDKLWRRFSSMTEVFTPFSSQANGDIQGPVSEPGILSASSTAGSSVAWDSISPGFGIRHVDGLSSMSGTSA